MEFAKAAPLERRGFARSSVVLFGRLMRADKREYNCQTLELAVGGLVLATDCRLEIGESVVVYLDLLGGVDGRVSRKVAGGYVIAINATPRRRARLTAQIQELAARLALAGQHIRRNRRLMVSLGLEIDDGSGRPSIQRCLNISVTGALIEATEPPPIGTAIRIGGRGARVVRHEVRGYAITFDEPVATLDWAVRLGQGYRA
ncbi:MAG: PilZ domain-containing protein [Hyphomicrobiaceae bacterium]|jgi:hypothetical protein